MKIIDKIYINGEFVKPDGTEVKDIINPSTKEVIGKVTMGNASDAKKAIAAAKRAFETFSKTSIKERIAILDRLYEAVMARQDDIAKSVVEEFGAPIKTARGTAFVGSQSIIYNKKVLEEYPFETREGNCKIVREPIGVCALITAWNAAPLQMIKKLVPALAVGCTAVIKPSSITAMQAQVVTECFHAADLPKGVVNVVYGAGSEVGDELCSSQDVAFISFTGSTEVGIDIYRNSAASMKKLVLELGGKSPHIILADADLSKAIPFALEKCFFSNGAMCVAGSRLIVPEHLLEKVEEGLKAEIEANWKVGDPWKEENGLGPMVTKSHFDTVQQYIQSGISEGAKLVTGGLGNPEGLENSYFMKPTVFSHVTMDMKIAREEIFAPVLCVLTYKTEEEALAIANDTEYGLAGYISSSDQKKAEELAKRIPAGGIYINNPRFNLGAMPHGGYKMSGIGREYGVQGLEEYLETKVIAGVEE